jgi:hypothetical protein
MATRDGRRNLEDLLASAIPVSLFREILIWPLALHLSEPAARPFALAEAVEKAADRIRNATAAVWRPVEDPTEHIPRPPDPGQMPQWDADRYAEGVYFHEFVQSFLFRRAVARKRRRLDMPWMRLFQRLDVSAVEVQLHPGDAKRFRLKVERLNLYLFSSGSAVLVLEISTKNASPPGQNWTLAEVENFHDRFRRAYIPFATVAKGGALTPGGVVAAAVALHYGSGHRAVFDSANEIDAMVGGYLHSRERNGRRIPPVFGHWRELLTNAVRLAPYAEADNEARWHHVVDERMPTVATVAVTNKNSNELEFFRRTRRGDLMRLCFADSAGESSRPFRNFERDHMFEWFRQDGTLYLASGYALVAYRTGGFFEREIETHMRRHYFQMALLAHFELATLLAFSTQISRAVAAYEPRAVSTEQFEDWMQAIEDEFLQFVHRFRFTGVTSHVQGQALFDLWRRQLRLKVIFDDLHREITSATEYLFNRAASRSAESGQPLSVIATLGVIGGLAFSFLGINILAQPGILAKVLALFGIREPNVSESALLQLAILVWIVALFTVLAFIALILSGGAARTRRIVSSPSGRLGVRPTVCAVHAGGGGRARAHVRRVISHVSRIEVSRSQLRLMTYRFFLGGRDLEMVEIRRLLDCHAPGQIEDQRLAWGAALSAYREELLAALGRGETPVFIELADDLPADFFERSRTITVDHHGALAGRDRPTSLEQVFALLGLPAEAWTRRLALVAANDRAHVAGKRAFGATAEEIAEIRAADRAAQGITALDEAEALRAIAARRVEGRVTIVATAGNTSSAVADLMLPEMGGPGFARLLVAMPIKVAVFGDGAAIQALGAAYPRSWWGGDLPAEGYWGMALPASRPRIIEELVARLR